LILNVNFEPLHVSSTKRALGLLLSGKAELILNGRGYIKTSNDKFEIPSIIRLSYMIKRPRPRVNLSKREVLRRDEYMCQYCGKKTTQLTIDHIIPKHAGGTNDWLNVVAACPPCNRRKGGKTPDQANMPLRRPPYEPRPSAMYRFGRHLKSRQEWEPFLNGW
ncbi:MAG: HNH endonuclease, partial [Anaerolineales bacterium]|nr:HNH endonuclease [Anaerolineales bacterium]